MFWESFFRVPYKKYLINRGIDQQYRNDTILIRKCHLYGANHGIYDC